MTTLRDIFIDSARTGKSLQKIDGSFPPGHNGSWNVQETPVRNTSHWLVTCARAYEMTQEVAFKDSIERAGNYLLSSKARPFNATFQIMEKKGWGPNGIVGQARVIEALLAAYSVLKSEQYLQLARNLVSKYFWFLDV